MTNISDQDKKLIELATATVKKFHVPKVHTVATAIKMKSGKEVVSINLQGSFGCTDICAEQIAIGKAISDETTDFDTIATVRHPKTKEKDQNVRVASPCGKCRELLYDYAPQANVIVRKNSKITKVKVKDLLPYRYSKK